MMKTLMKIWSIGIALLMLLPEAAAASEKPKHGGTLVFGIAKDITTLNPFVRMRSTDMYVRTLVYESLLDTDAKGEIVPALAESWAVSKSGLEYTLKLRRGVLFHNDKELTAEDVKSSAEYAMQPKNRATGFDYLRELKSVEAPDRTTIKFTLKQPMAVFLSYAATLRPFPVVPKDSVPSASEKLDSMPAGTGPFVFQGWKSEREIVFVRNKSYWQKGLPFLDRVTLKPVEDNTVRFTSLRAGDLDMIERTPYPFAAKVIKGEFPDLKVTEAKYAGFRRIIFNVADPPFDHVKLRQAVAYALDKNVYLQGAFWGFGESANQQSPKLSPWFVKSLDRERDPAKVKSLLREAGVGSDFEVEILGRRGGEEEYQIIQQQLATAGIKARIAVLEFAAYRERQARGDFQLIVFGGEVPNDPGEVLPVEVGCAEEETKAKKRNMNVSGYCNKSVDRLLGEAGRITDRQKRLELYTEVIKTLQDEVPEIPLAFVPRHFTYRKKVNAFTTDFDGRFNTSVGGLSRVWIDS